MDAKSAVCTLFEGDYHFGVGALVNSLYKNGYRGMVWAGYRGKLPPWATPIQAGDGYAEYAIREECLIRFIQVETERHLALYKPGFMRALWNDHCRRIENLFYFDPDIVIKCDWSFFEEWAACGLAVCEDVNSPMPDSHPIRHAWRQLSAERDIDLAVKTEAYVNSGFLGIASGCLGFLQQWSDMIDLIETRTGKLRHHLHGQRPSPFYNTDQDALNMAIMRGDYATSLIGKEGMDFIPGGYTMSHAAGGGKPWRKRFFSSALRGIPPTLADKAYWQNVMHPICMYRSATLRLSQWELMMSSAVGRYCRKG
jgi:hypothetical protein